MVLDEKGKKYSPTSTPPPRKKGRHMTLQSTKTCFPNAIELRQGDREAAKNRRNLGSLFMYACATSGGGGGGCIVVIICGRGQPLKKKEDKTTKKQKQTFLHMQLSPTMPQTNHSILVSTASWAVCLWAVTCTHFIKKKKIETSAVSNNNDDDDHNNNSKKQQQEQEQGQEQQQQQQLQPQQQ